jgi:hypothetical protein
MELEHEIIEFTPASGTTFLGNGKTHLPSMVFESKHPLRVQRVVGVFWYALSLSVLGTGWILHSGSNTGSIILSSDHLPCGLQKKVAVSRHPLILRRNIVISS